MCSRCEEANKGVVQGSLVGKEALQRHIRDEPQVFDLGVKVAQREFENQQWESFDNRIQQLKKELHFLQQKEEFERLKKEIKAARQRLGYAS